ncbi:MAG: HAMP domain-containing protein [Alphaproteobacteria bacterium]|nr:HAMP domain-containing protein [Alphaproteobacteria bacterium]MBV9373028.1 HAMP domain-containing protein [Alphaproteobacteria bacterium]MBV9902911.1 HAMP domain-containing protein [Alphaproteobacteria bacterium]
MNALAPLTADTRPRWRRRLSVALHRSRFVPAVELLTVAALIVIAAISYFVIKESGKPETLLSPPAIAALLVANLVPAMALMVLLARRVAMRRAAKSQVGGRGRLHVRLVALFSAIASVPTLLVVIFASLLFQNGLQFWFSERSQTVLASAENVSQIYEREHRGRIRLDVEVMGADMVNRINEFGLNSKRFENEFIYQTAARQLDESAIVTLDAKGNLHRPVQWNPDHRPIAERLQRRMLVALPAGEARIFQSTKDRVEAVIRLDPQAAVYFYGARAVSPDAITALGKARDAASDYQRTLERSRNLQFRFNAILLLVSLLIVAVAIWIALAIADRMVRPVGELVQAARRVGAGDLTARVPGGRIQDEVATLGNVFNRMTRRLEEQTGALVSANSQLDSRRAFIEAVLSGVTAGVVSLDQARNVRLINSSAEALLEVGKEAAIGRKLAELAPELDAQLDSEEREGIVQLVSAGEPRTLAVKRVRVEGGHVLTFDDITEQLNDQRRAAWSDVARRIAHEIKNPLTPIQLAAERLQRRYGKEVTSDSDTFEQLTGTIVRQVGDLRRMVDEFSSFARMPKPVFAEEPVAEIARHALFLHEVAHPDIVFSLDAPTPSPLLVCDRRQLGQALTNIVKNAVEAIQQKREDGRRGERDEVALRIRETEGRLVMEVCDTGMGLPSERGRLTEPYMTTRVKGTGLGLAIVKKIVEEHFGSIEFEDEAGGGTLVRLVFDTESLARLAGGPEPHNQAASG